MNQTGPTRHFDNWTLVFDLDGTLVDSAPDLLRALNHTLAGMEVAPVQLGDIRTMIGHGAKAMIRSALSRAERDCSEVEISALWSVFIAYYQENIAVDSRPFEGAEAALTELSAAGARLAICTNKTQALSEQVLDALGLSHHFCAIVGADSVPRKKPDGDHILRTLLAADGDLSRAIMIGDSLTDERAARSAGLPFVFVPFGYEAEPAEAISADAVVSCYSELVSVLSAITA